MSVKRCRPRPPMCRFFVAGTCKHGAQCKFSHDQAHPDSFICPYFVQGHCSYGDRCGSAKLSLLVFLAHLSRPAVAT